MKPSPVLAFISVTLYLLATMQDCLAEEGNTDKTEIKLTLGSYKYSGYSGTDLNIRARKTDTDYWFGAYTDHEFGNQERLGADTTFQLTKVLQLQPSLQIASRGLLAGSANIQVGDIWFAYAGLGRTNLKPYFNLNFDPNDAATYGIGHRTEGNQLYNLYVIADNRLGTHQQDWHLTAKLPFNTQHLAIDLLYKHGNGDTGVITAWGYSAAWNWEKLFLRVTKDPHQNYSTQDAWRIAAGIRYWD